jgi:hypothetical protein
VPTFECDLERVLADERDILDAQLVGFEALDASKSSGDAGLAATLRTRTSPAKAIRLIGAEMATLPRDHHDLAFAVDVDCQRKCVGVFQGRPYRTLMTGS